MIHSSKKMPDSSGEFEVFRGAFPGLHTCSSQRWERSTLLSRMFDISVEHLLQCPRFWHQTTDQRILRLHRNSLSDCELTRLLAFLARTLIFLSQSS